jgi:glycosyltransferase involved in cell wall biosynthesis
MSASQPFRIVHAIAQLRFGAGRYVVDTAIAQHRREPGRVAVVLSVDAEEPWRSSTALTDELVHADVPVFHCGDFFHRDPATLKAAARALRETLVGLSGEWPTDIVVHAHTAMAAAAARWAGAPCVVLTCHGWGPNRPAEFHLQDALAYSLCDAVTSPSRHWAAVVQEKTARESVHVLPYGFNLARLRSRTPDDRPRAPRIVSVGELSSRKGADLLIDAMPLVWDRVPDAELHFIGDGQLAQELREQARGLDATGGRVVFHGQLEDPVSILDDFDVFALASRSDNQPVAIVEAMAMGLPIVSTGVGGIAELVESARCGFIVPPDNVYELGMALSILLDTTREGRRELGAAGARHVHEHSGIEKHVEALERFYGRNQSESANETRTDWSAAVNRSGPTRLHLGCGLEKREGWVNVDARAEASPDVVARVHELPMFDSGSVDTIEACHLFEHLPVHEARAALAEWARVLRDGGELLLELPNFDACVASLGHAEDSHGYDLAMVGIYGWPPHIEKYGPEMEHRWGWSPTSLAMELRTHGFSGIEQVPIAQAWRPAACIGRDFRIRAVKSTLSAEVAA